MNKALPSALTTYDLYKTAAVLLMLADHVGFYFFGEDLWWRVAGRMCVPIWFFLIGYTETRTIESRLWIGGGLLVMGSLLSGMGFLPLNILFTIICVRLTLDEVMTHAREDRHVFWGVSLMLALLALPTAMLTEYGTLGLLLAMLGYLCRHVEVLPGQKELFLPFVAAVFVIVQTLSFGFSSDQVLALSVGSLVMLAGVYGFKPKTFPAITKKLPGFLVTVAQFTGRRTLEIYVVHLLIFKALGVVLEPDRFPLFGWKLAAWL